MDELTDVLMDATCAIEAGYFKLAIDGDAAVYRERVYCYELYHQMRMRWPAGCLYVLNGEVDKSGHLLLRELKLDGFKPDFLIHRPGWMLGNFAIMEVKSQSARSDDIKKDLLALTRFRREANYRRAIYLVFGEKARRTLQRIRLVANRLDQLADIELWVHTTPGACAEHVETLPAKERSAEGIEAGKPAAAGGRADTA